MINPFTVLAVAFLAGSAVTRAATLTYEAAGQLSYVLADANQWTVGTPFTVRFSYDPASLQIASIWGDFPAPAVMVSGEFFLNTEGVLSFTNQLFWHSDDPSGQLSFNLITGVPAEVGGIPVEPGTVTPGVSHLSMFVVLPGGFLPDGKLFDDSTSIAISVFGHMTFDQRVAPAGVGWGDADSIRLVVPEPGILPLGACGLLAFALVRRAGRLPHNAACC